MDQIMGSVSTADDKSPGRKAAHRRLAQLLDQMKPSDSIAAIMKLAVVNPRQRVSLAAEAGPLHNSLIRSTKLNTSDDALWRTRLRHHPVSSQERQRALQHLFR